MKILFVCIGNICRSPIAEGVLQHKCNQLNLNWTIDSVGTHNYHVGEKPHTSSQQICKENGIDISNQKARQFTKSDFEKFDIIYALATDVQQTLFSKASTEEEKQKIKLLLDELYDTKGKSVKDPWYGEYDGYIDVFDEIELACEAIIKEYYTPAMN
jgi:protein-tyrosine phosphatase